MTLLHRRCRRRCRSSEQTIERRCRRRVEEHVAVRIRRRVVVVVVRPKHAQIREQRGQVRERKRVRVEHAVRVVVAGGDGGGVLVVAIIGGAATLLLSRLWRHSFLQLSFKRVENDVRSSRVRWYARSNEE